MQLPALAIQQPDYGRTLMQAESIKGARTQNRLLEAEGATNAAAAEARTNLLAPTSPQDAMAAGGGPTNAAAAQIGQPQSIDFGGQAFRQYAAMDPQGAEQMFDLMSKLDDRQREMVNEQVEEAAKGYLWVEQQPDKNQAWKQFRAQADKMGLDMSDAPEQYDPGYVQREVMQALSVTEILAQQTAGQTTNTKEFEYAQGNPGFEDYRARQRKAGATNVTTTVGPQGVDYGKPPSGMAWARNEDGSIALRPDQESGFSSPIAVPIAGGPVDTDRADTATAAAAKKQQQGIYADVVIEDIGRIIDKVNSAIIPVTGFGSIVSSVPGTTAHDLASLVDTVRASIGFDRLQQMREASPTGGALGAVSEGENKLLQSTMGSLEQSQNREQFVFNLNRVQDIYLDTIHGKGNWSKDDEGAIKLKEATPSGGDVRRPEFLTERVWSHMNAESRELFRTK